MVAGGGEGETPGESVEEGRAGVPGWIWLGGAGWDGAGCCFGACDYYGGSGPSGGIV